MPPKRILFPYDFSGPAQRVAPFVRALAERLDALVTLYSVVPPAFAPLPAGMGPDLRAGDTTTEWKLALQRQLDQALVGELAGVRVERVADGGDPPLRIANFVRSHGIDLVMMATHGVGTFRRSLVGSVTSKVLHDAECPVWTSAHTDTQTASETPRRIVCAVDGAPATAALARWATDFAGGVGADLSFVHAVGPVSDWPSLDSERRLQEEVRQEARGRLESALKSAGIEAPLRVAVGDIVPTVTDEAQRERADLLIIGRGSIAEPFGRLRTHAFGIVQRSACPVLSV
jgi:nucleotide-binding universal stress UspA family protein